MSRPDTLRNTLFAFSVVIVATVPVHDADARPVRAGGVTYEGRCASAPPVGSTRLWMGHFTGGRYGRKPADPHIATPRLVEWADEYRCFSSQTACYSWQRSMHRAYGRIQSNWTCLPIR